MCTHNPPCPPAHAPDHVFARVVARQDDIGWSLLCNKVIVFDDSGEVLPDGTVVEPERRRILATGAARLRPTAFA